MKRNNKLTIKLSDEEKRSLENMAKRAGISMSDIVRLLCGKGTAKALTQLKNIAGSR